MGKMTRLQRWTRKIEVRFRVLDDEGKYIDIVQFGALTKDGKSFDIGIHIDAQLEGAEFTLAIMDLIRAEIERIRPDLEHKWGM